jgi:hypothetical protein
LAVSVARTANLPSGPTKTAHRKIMKNKEEIYTTEVNVVKITIKKLL